MEIVWYVKGITVYNFAVGEKKKELKSPVLVSYVESLTEPSSKDEVWKRLVSLEEFTLTKYNTLIDENFLFERLEVESKIVYIFYSQRGDCLHFHVYHWATLLYL